MPTVVNAEGVPLIHWDPRIKPTISKMKQIIAEILREQLETTSYQSEKASAMTKDLAEMIKVQLKACNYPRYKYVVQVLISEQRGEGASVCDVVGEKSNHNSRANSMHDKPGDRANAKKRRRPNSGHYEDPTSPIASTPMKTQSVKKREKAESAKALYAKRGKISTEKKSADSLRHSQNSEDEPFFSPRKLDHEYDSEDVVAYDSNNEGDRSEAIETLEQSGKSHDAGDVIFSPTLKAPRTRRSSISTSSSTSRQSLKAYDRREYSGYVSERSVGSWYDGEPDDDDQSMFAYEDSIVTSDECEANVDESTADLSEFNPFSFMKHLPKYEKIVRQPRQTVLPPVTPSTRKPCLVLDLDETLVHCSVDDLIDSQLQFDVRHQSQFDVAFNGSIYNVHVRFRPHLQNFLENVSKRFEVVVFTASQRAYAEKLLDRLDPTRDLIQFRLYREDCLEVDGNYLKDLNILGRDLSQVILVDNSPHAFGYQVTNGVPIESWFDDEDDEELVKLLPFLERLADADDVRPIIERQFQMQMLIDNADAFTI